MTTEYIDTETTVQRWDSSRYPARRWATIDDNGYVWVWDIETEVLRMVGPGEDNDNEYEAYSLENATEILQDGGHIE